MYACANANPKAKTIHYYYNSICSMPATSPARFSLIILKAPSVWARPFLLALCIRTSCFTFSTSKCLPLSGYAFTTRSTYTVVMSNNNKEMIASITIIFFNFNIYADYSLLLIH